MPLVAFGVPFSPFILIFPKTSKLVLEMKVTNGGSSASFAKVELVRPFFAPCLNLSDGLDLSDGLAGLHIQHPHVAVSVATRAWLPLAINTPLDPDTSLLNGPAILNGPVAQGVYFCRLPRRNRA
jgi:hypothetical protein